MRVYWHQNEAIAAFLILSLVFYYWHTILAAEVCVRFVVILGHGISRVLFECLHGIFSGITLLPHLGQLIKELFRLSILILSVLTTIMDTREDAASSSPPPFVSLVTMHSFD